MSIADLYKSWAKSDPHFHQMVMKKSEAMVLVEKQVNDTKEILASIKTETETITPVIPGATDNENFDQDNFHGIRMLRQDPWENLISFICSSNNNIKRISQMVDNLCTHFGTHLGTFNGVEYFDFPTPYQLAGPETESKLRDLGFGYRAKYIHQTAEMIASAVDLLDLDTIDPATLAKLKNKSKKRKKADQDQEQQEEEKLQKSDQSYKKGLEYLCSLREQPYEKAHLALLQFSGVGPKVADCVCLMSLDKHDCVPVDTHVWQIARRDYKFKSSFGKSGGSSKKSAGNGNKDPQPTKSDYDNVASFFKDLWGEYAGWAHSVLFTADLKDLNNGVNSVDGATNGKVPKKSDSTSVKKETVKRTLKKDGEIVVAKRQKVTTVKSETADLENSNPLSNRGARLRKRRELFYGE